MREEFSYSAYPARAATPVTRRTPHLGTVIHAPDALRLYLDGATAAAVADQALPTSIVRTENYLGRSLSWHDINRVCPTFGGKLSELLVFRRPLEGAERLDVERYLTSKYRCCS